MNNDQRKFLIKQVEDTCQKQVGELEEQIPEKPSLNNYLIAAFLDNTIQFADISILKTKMRATVLKFGTSDKLVNSESSSWSSRRRQTDEEDTVNVKAEDLFIIPQNYKDALAEYEKKKQEIDIRKTAEEYMSVEAGKEIANA